MLGFRLIIFVRVHFTGLKSLHQYQQIIKLRKSDFLREIKPSIANSSLFLVFLGCTISWCHIIRRILKETGILCVDDFSFWLSIQENI
ncbi:unnamed protein product [Callosobruchus maculatus]|uniref:Uncharacterized protein n=1 Tax=Callosobruchus maculatus TaxID=64391 RepID=A0A653DFA7_CALMS|nr:unnamed protein product [Callosobruchus maculatus]